MFCLFAYYCTSPLLYGGHHLAVMATLLTFVTMFRKAHEENVKQAELEKKKAQKEAAEAEKSRSAQLASKNVLILDYKCFTVLLNPKSSFMDVF